MIAHQMLFSKAGIDISYITLQQFLLSSWEEERIYSLLSPIFAIPTQPPTPQAVILFRWVQERYSKRGQENGKLYYNILKSTPDN